MKKAFTLLFLLAIMAASLSVKAQEVTILLNPGWTWIGYPGTDTLNLETAFGSFTPMEGDIIKAQVGNAEFYDGYGWYGTMATIMPGKGYMYKSNRTEPIAVTVSMPFPQQSVTTAEPTDITATSAVVGGTVTIGEGNHVFVRGVCWGTESMPDVDGSRTTDATVTGSQTVTLDNLTPSTTYYVRAYVATDYGLAYGNQQSFTTEAGGGSSGDHTYVDLGLPSGLLWATCNVGAGNPEDYGDYFAWGETQPKDTYNSTSYQYSEDDAATANWGNGWRMPTKEEWEELYNNTTSTWTTQNGVNGRLFTANNGNSIFLPAAGYRQNSGLGYAGSYAGYWSSSLYTDDPDDAWVFRFTSGYYNMAHGNRYLGLSVRPVRVGSQSTSFIINATANPAEGGEVSGGGAYQEGAECTLTATANEGYTFTNWTENGEVVSVDATYSFTVNGDRNLVVNFAVSGGEHAYVDLGLPSGLLWATCNVGAEAPEDYGDYFAWGETQPKDTYNWSTYQYCNGSSSTLTKYCNNSSYGYNGFTDNLTTLLPEDDAATANWGSGWRMPTKEEFQELYNNTTVTWTTQNGVNGRLFTASNGNSLFLPAAGGRWDDELDLAGYYGFYWSSSLYAGYPDYAWGLGFNSDYAYVDVHYRNYGFSVRPVREN